MSNKRAATFHGLTPAEIEADVQAKGNDRSAWPYAVGVEERIAAGAAARVALDRGNPEPAVEAGEREALEGWSFEHRPILSMRDGSIASCKCLDRVFYKDSEDWDQHIADSLLARRSQPAPRTVSAAGITAVLTDHYYRADDEALCGCGWEPDEYGDCDVPEQWDEWAREFAAHQAEQVAALSIAAVDR